MMLFHIIGVKEEGKFVDNSMDSDEQKVIRHNIDVLVETSDIANARKILESWGVIIVSLKEHTGSETNFGKIYMIVNYEGQKIRVVNYMDEIDDSARFFLNIGLDILDINYLNNPKPEKEIRNILEEARIFVNEQKKRLKELMDKKKKQKENVFSNQQILKIRGIIEEAIARGDELEKRAVGVVDGNKIKKMKDIRSELSKLRMGTNEVKIVSVGEEYLNLMEDIEMEFLENKKKELGTVEIINKDSIVSNIDVLKEYARFFKAIKTKGIGGSLKNEYGDYVSFGLGGIYLKFLGLDFKKKFSNVRDVFYKAYDRIEFVLIAVIIETIIYSLFASLGGDIELKNFILLSNLGIIGLVIYFIKFIRRKNIMYLIILIPIVVIICIVLMRNLRINLAL